MQFGRLLRRLQARWRLHRMEWEAMHRPLDPPRGYERFYSERAVFPGLSRTWDKKESLDDYVKGFKKAWKIYRHDFVYDPEVAAMEEQFGIVQQKKTERNVAVLLKRTEQTIKQGVNTADEVIEKVQELKPEAEQLLENRVSVLSEAMNEFSQGYRDGVDGKFKFWEDHERGEHIEIGPSDKPPPDSGRTEHQIHGDLAK